MKSAWAAKKGFTIIELLVIIVVVGILSTIMVVSYTGIQQRSRDTQRDGHIAQIKIAIEKYHADRGSYPDACGADNTPCAISSLATPLASYFANVPHDPKFDLDSTSDYRYIRGTPTLDAYAIRVNYEAKAICMTGQNVQAAWWSAIPIC